MLSNYLKIAYRNLVRNKAYSFINIGGLAVGMAVAIMIGLWMNDELTFDHYHKNHDRIAQVYQSQTFNGKIGTGQAIPRPLEMALRDSYGDNFKHLVMSSWRFRSILAHGEKKMAKEGNFMQPGAPEMLGLEMLAGQRDGLKETNSILLAETTAKALFGNEEAMGKIVKLNNEHNLKVTGVYADIPANNDFSKTTYIIPWDQLLASAEWMQRAVDQWGNNSFQLYAQIADNTTMEQVSAKIKDVKMKAADEDVTQHKPEIFLLPMNDWHLKASFENGVQTGGRIENVWLFGIIGTFVLLLACINFMNLSTARSEKRAKEVGIRKSVGSVRTQLITQFLSESFLVVGMAFVVAMILVLIALPSFNTLADKKIEFPWANGYFWGASLLFILFTALLSGSYPALYLSSFQPVKVLKGTFRVGRFAALPRKVLVVMQFTVSVALIIGTIIVFRQIQHSKNRPIGYDREGLIQIPLSRGSFDGKFDFLRQEFINSGAVVEMSSASSPTTEVYSNRSGFLWEGKPEGFQEDLAWTMVSPEYVQSLGLKIIAGRDFSREIASDSNAVILNKTAVKYMGLKDPIGTLIRDDDEEDPEPPLTVIGVIDDMIMQSPYEPVKQSMYVFDKYNNASYYNLRLNPAQSASQSLATVESIYKKNFPDLPFEYQFVDEEYSAKFASEERIGKLAGVFTGLAILISCLGLFGLASYMAEQRTKEIGVRKVLGASVASLWRLLSKDFVFLVLIALLIASPLAWYFMEGWLQKYNYRTELSWWVFAAAGTGALVITLLTVSFQAIKAALMNPVKSLRSE
ncbi:ABC transporter permease [Persicitalea jodogahamensis]|uniref:ABC transporter permease n=1 Tax=Persicitalea jodogahamensis TaxID=402147 RepID=A0A8J3GBR8_9BACT|nr:ABC transporter permease [Persicitalea jodogahamensis]GHB83683.1 ABC transporter permease [Persicitalea jodogahamensis]